MADHNQAVQVTSRYISDLVRRRALALIAKHDESLAKVYDKIAAGVRKDLRAVGFTEKQVADILKKHFAETFDERVRHAEQAMIDAAREGRKVDAETFDAVFGAEGAALRPLPSPSFAPVLKLSSKRAKESEDESR